MDLFRQNCGEGFHGQVAVPRTDVAVRQNGGLRLAAGSDGLPQGWRQPGTTLGNCELEARHFLSGFVCIRAVAGKNLAAICPLLSQS